MKTALRCVYPDGTSCPFTAGKIVHPGGAGGRIVRVHGQALTLAKLYLNPKIASQYQSKLDAMISCPPNLPPKHFEKKRFEQIAWPKATILDKKDRLHGFIMPEILLNEAIILDVLLQKASRQFENVPENYYLRFVSARNLASIVAELHKVGHHIIDMKPENISVYREVMFVALLDCDSFSIRDTKGNRFPAEHYSDQYIAPEAKTVPPNRLGEEQDKFALAVIIFRLLNNGIHPFQGKPKKGRAVPRDLQGRVYKKLYPYGSTVSQHQDPSDLSLHEWLEDDTLTLFEQAFTRTTNRPTAKDWRDHLDFLRKSGALCQCRRNREHVHFSKGCGLCLLERPRGRKPTPPRKPHRKPTTRTTRPKAPPPPRPPPPPPPPAFGNHVPNAAEALQSLAHAVTRSRPLVPRVRTWKPYLAALAIPLAGGSAVDALVPQGPIHHLAIALWTAAFALALLFRISQTPLPVRVLASLQGGLLTWALLTGLPQVFHTLTLLFITILPALPAAVFADKFLHIAQINHFRFSTSALWSTTFPISIALPLLIVSYVYAPTPFHNLPSHVSPPPDPPASTSAPSNSPRDTQSVSALLHSVKQINDPAIRLKQYRRLYNRYPDHKKIETAFGLELINQAKTLPLLKKQSRLTTIRNRFPNNKTIQSAISQELKNPFLQ